MVIPQDIATVTQGAGTFDPFTLDPNVLGSINDLNIGAIFTSFPDIDDPSVTSCF